MRLILDIGNTRLKWVVGGTSGGSSQLQIPIVHDNDYRTAFEKIQKEINIIGRQHRVNFIAIGSVSSESLRISKVCQEIWGVEPTYIASKFTACGVRNSYAEPNKLGVDRWAAMVEAYNNAQSAVCVFDLGSAFTIDAVNTEGYHLGGYILPGLEMSRQSIVGGTAQVNLDNKWMGSSKPLWGRSTNAAVNNGIIYTAVTLIQNTIKSLRLELKAPVESFITGGDSIKVLPFVNDLVRYDEYLVLKGIRRLADSV